LIVMGGAEAVMTAAPDADANGEGEGAGEQAASTSMIAPSRHRLPRRVETPLFVRCLLRIGDSVPSKAITLRSAALRASRSRT
jgi:hypothetical protein